MLTKMNCPGCSTPLRLRDDMAGRTIKCPCCAQTITLPAEGATIVAEASGARAIAAKTQDTHDKETEVTTRPCPECGRFLDSAATKCDSCNTRLYKPCPRCGEEGAQRVAWTAWGSYYGSALFAHVRCPVCDHTYNGRTGRSNLIPAIIFVTVPLLLILAILCVLGWIVYNRGLT
ncbi:MAG TPA: hypothetical protein VH592_24580 [Gemmataceae bacterium]|jgi:hypothetical protein